jgi:hypothetical protein
VVRHGQSRKPSRRWGRPRERPCCQLRSLRATCRATCRCLVWSTSARSPLGRGRPARERKPGARGGLSAALAAVARLGTGARSDRLTAAPAHATCNPRLRAGCFGQALAIVGSARRRVARRVAHRMGRRGGEGLLEALARSRTGEPQRPLRNADPQLPARDMKTRPSAAGPPARADGIAFAGGDSGVPQKPGRSRLLGMGPPLGALRGGRRGRERRSAGCGRGSWSSISAFRLVSGRRWRATRHRRRRVDAGARAAGSRG